MYVLKFTFYSALKKKYAMYMFEVISVCKGYVVIQMRFKVNVGVISFSCETSEICSPSH